jgi:hypothetical protein
MHVRPWFELLPPILQEVTMPATTDRPSSGGPACGNRRRVRPWHLVPRDVFVHDEQP